MPHLLRWFKDVDEQIHIRGWELCIEIDHQIVIDACFMSFFFGFSEIIKLRFYSIHEAVLVYSGFLFLFFQPLRRLIIYP